MRRIDEKGSTEFAVAVEVAFRSAAAPLSESMMTSGRRDEEASASASEDEDEEKDEEKDEEEDEAEDEGE